MPNYRRFRIPGVSYFFTVTLADRDSRLLIDRIDALRSAYRRTVADMPILCDAMVVLPDHLHAVWTLPPGDSNFPERWRRLKARFTHEVGLTGRRSKSKRDKRERGLWQRRYWEHKIRDQTDYRMHVAYCWGNPVKHGYVERPADWTFSSIHRDIRAGMVDPEWAGAIPDGEFGE